MQEVNFDEGFKVLLNILEELEKKDLPLEEIIAKTKQAKQIYEDINKQLQNAKSVIEGL